MPVIISLALVHARKNSESIEGREGFYKTVHRAPYQKNRGRVETQPRFKIQYPMKNHSKDAG
jgi:hypothetical protein